MSAVPLAPGEVTVGEVARRVDELAHDVDEMRRENREDFLLLRNEIRLAAVVTKDVYEADQKSIDKRVTGLEDWQRWAMRIVLGAVLVAVVALVIRSTPTPSPQPPTPPAPPAAAPAEPAEDPQPPADVAPPPDDVDSGSAPAGAPPAGAPAPPAQAEPPPAEPPPQPDPSPSPTPTPVVEVCPPLLVSCIDVGG